MFECREQACAAAAVVRGAGARRRAVYRYLGLRPQFVQLLISLKHRLVQPLGAGLLLLHLS